MSVSANPTLSYNKWLLLPLLNVPSFFPSIHLSVHPSPLLFCPDCLLPSTSISLFFPSSFLSPSFYQSLPHFIPPCKPSSLPTNSLFFSFQYHNKHPPSNLTLHLIYLPPSSIPLPSECYGRETRNFIGIFSHKHAPFFPHAPIPLPWTKLILGFCCYGKQDVGIRFGLCCHRDWVFSSLRL